MVNEFDRSERPGMKAAKTKTGSDEKESGEPSDLRRALAANSPAQAAWHKLTPIARRDFTSWIESAKKADTRERRIERACENLAAGKRRPCCYAVVPMDLYKALGSPSAKRSKSQWSELTPNERRDYIDWVESADEKDTRKARIQEVCVALAEGKRRP